MSLEVTGTDTDRSATYDFLLVFCSNHGPISSVSEINNDFSQKSQISPTSMCLTPTLREFSLDFFNGGSAQKINTCLLDGGQSLTMCVSLDAISECDRQTDGRNCHDHIALCIHSMLTRGKNIFGSIDVDKSL